MKRELETVLKSFNRYNLECVMGEGSTQAYYMYNHASEPSISVSTSLTLKSPEQYLK